MGTSACGHEQITCSMAHALRNKRLHQPAKKARKPTPARFLDRNKLLQLPGRTSTFRKGKPFFSCGDCTACLRLNSHAPRLALLSPSRPPARSAFYRRLPHHTALQAAGRHPLRPDQTKTPPLPPLPSPPTPRLLSTTSQYPQSLTPRNTCQPLPGRVRRIQSCPGACLFAE